MHFSRGAEGTKVVTNSKKKNREGRRQKTEFDHGWADKHGFFKPQRNKGTKKMLNEESKKAGDFSHPVKRSKQMEHRSRHELSRRFYRRKQRDGAYATTTGGKL
jgi:hypothetical protein